MAEPLFLAVDAGTTGVTVTVFDRRFRARLSRSEDFPQHYPRPGWVEHDAGAIRALTLRLVREAAREAGGAIAAVGLTNQRETVVPFDAETGVPLHRAIVWQCRRTSERCAALRAQGHDSLVSSRTGLVIDPYFSATKMAWLLETDSACRAAAARGTLRLVTIDAWLVYALTGGRVLATEPSNASRTSLYDIDQRAWSAELLKTFGVPAEVLAGVQASAGHFGDTDPALVGFRAPITGVLGDQQAALFGHAGFAEGDTKITYGTGCFLLRNVGVHRPPFVRGVLTTLGADRTGAPIYLQEGSVFIAGAAVQWIRDGLGLVSEASETERLAASLTDNDGVYLVPAFTGLGAPYWDPDARGLLCGLTRGTTRAHIARAVLESIAYQVRDLWDLTTIPSDPLPVRLRVDGGAAANDWLMQFQADLLGVPIERGRDLEATSRGAAMIAAVGLDPGVDLEAADPERPAPRIFRPEMSRAEADRRLKGWARAVQRARN